jgi:hypothetical protein
MSRTHHAMSITLTKLKFVNLILLFCLALPNCFGQVNQLARFELELTENDENEDFKVASLNQEGLLIYRNLMADTQSVLELIRVDTSLTESWRGFIAIQRNLRVSHVISMNKLAFILLKSGTQVTGNFQIVVAKIEDGAYGIYDVKNLIPFDPTDFLVTSQGVMIGGYFNYRPLVLFYNFATKASKILPGFFNEQGELNQLKLNENGTVDVIVSANNFERKKCLWIRNYDEQGELIKTTVLEPETGKNLIFGRSTKMPNDAQVVAGVYGNKNGKYSRGIFVAEINQVGEYKTNYYNFGDLQNFFSYMKAKKEKRVKDRIERKKVKGKKIKFNYRLLVHEIVPYKDKFVMLGEAFYPKYRYYNGMNYNSGVAAALAPTMRGEQIFDGYQYTHAVVIGFDARGNLKWDNSFEINDVKSFELQQFVRIAPAEDHIVLLYFFDNLIRSKIIKDNQVLEGKTEDPIKSNFTTDIIKEKNTESGKLDYWYSKNFFASGVQKIKNTGTGKEIGYRKVFFINKLRYQ